ncbi:MAG: alpha/beta hydrolase [Chloroflexi bacterium]|nr:alpha/beta hydrolase [Chloroflexota bacterium]MBT7080249.1 alpha/beta hydrolase [Chloroflexota bacterium]MBT7289329.1 alpha/beta hydrolase [Chloroflexota bacterium]
MVIIKRAPVLENPSAFGLTYEDISFLSREDDVDLKGWFLPAAGSDRLIIMVHGVDVHRADPSIGMLNIAAALVQHGFNVFTFDLRGHGESDGRSGYAGHHEKKDLHGALDYAVQRGFSKIGVLGFSLGAAIAIMSAAENGDISSIVADSSFSNMKDIIVPQFTKRTGLPKIFLRPLVLLARMTYRFNFMSIKPIESLSAFNKPVFFIHGDQDETIPVEHASQLYEACSHPQKQLWITSGVTHVRSYAMYNREYMDKVTAFFDATL